MIDSKHSDNIPKEYIDLLAENNPFSLFRRWMIDAEKVEIEDPNAMTLATVDGTGMPNIRTVLLKDFSKYGPVFYTNCESTKGHELLEQKKAACLFYWKSLRRQVRMRGPITHIDNAQSDAYFASRDRESQLGAWASQQSHPLQNRNILKQRMDEFDIKYAHQPVPRPPYWMGICIQPLEMEFWIERPSRLHERLIFKLPSSRKEWHCQRIYP